MLVSLNEPLDNQPNWNRKLSKSFEYLKEKTNEEKRIKKKRIKNVADAAEMLMTLTHVAEAARPTDETWESWKKVMDDVIRLSKSLEETFQKLSNDVFKKQNRKEKTQDECNTLLVEIHRLMADDSNRQIKDSIKEKYPALDVVSSLRKISGLRHKIRKREITRLGLDSASPQSAEFLEVLDDRDESAERKRNLLQLIPLSEKIYKLLIQHAQKIPTTYAQEVY